jgi:hypothetical protein
MKATFVTKVITTINPCAKGWPWWGRKAELMSQLMSEGAMDL